MKQNQLLSILAFICILVTFTHQATQLKFCQATIDGSSTTPQNTYYIHDKDQYIQLSATQILLDMKTQIEDDGNVAYTYLLESNAGTGNFDLRIVRFDIDGEPSFSKTYDTTIVNTDSNPESRFIFAKSGVVALDLGSNNIKFFAINSSLQFSTATFTKADTEQILQISIGGIIENTRDYYVLTKDTVTPGAKLYSSSFSGPASHTMANTQNFIFANQYAFIEIDSSASTTAGLKLYLTSAPNTVVPITGTAPVFKTAAGINMNYQVVVLDFEDQFFVAMYDEPFLNSVMFSILDGSDAPNYANVLATSNSDDPTLILSYQTDYTSSIFQLTTDTSTGNVVHIAFAFADWYWTIPTGEGLRQFMYFYQTPGSPTGDDSSILNDISWGNALNRKISTSFISTVDTQRYNIFIFKYKSGYSSIMRFYYDIAAVVPGTYFYDIAAGQLTKDFDMSLSTDAKALLTQKYDQIQIFTFEIACMCTVTTVSQFICFGLSLECTIAIKNVQVDCSKQHLGVSTITNDFAG